MAGVVNTQAHRAARNVASIAFADVGALGASLRLYTAPGGSLLAVRSLGKPCGVVRALDGRIVLNAPDTAEVAIASGAATWGEWCNGAGVAISGGRVTDAMGRYTDAAGDLVVDPEGIGAFVLNSLSPERVGTMVYAGGLVLLESGLIG